MEGNCLETDLTEMEKSFPFYVERVRLMLQDKHDLSISEKCNGFIERCLRLKDGNLEKAVKLVKAFHAATADFQVWDATLLPSLHHGLYKNRVIVPLKTDTSGCRIYIIHAELWDPQKSNFDEFIACCWMMLQYSNAEFVDVQTKGFVTIWDFINFSAKQAWAVKQWRMLSLAKWIQNGVAGRMKGFHAINHPRVINFIYAGIRPFLKEKLKKRISFHNNIESLLDHVAPTSLPTYLGGILDPESCIDWSLTNALLKSDAYFQDMIINRVPTK